MDKVINFNQIRIEAELDRFREGRLDLDRVSIQNVRQIKTDYYEKLTAEYRQIADAFLAEYQKFQNANREEVLNELRQDYSKLFLDFATTHSDFAFPGVLQHYRYGINPVLAIYYELQNLCAYPERDQDMHTWLENMIKDPEFSHKIISALEHDIRRLKHIIVTYYGVLCQDTDHMPVELYHARKSIEEFSLCCGYFKQVFAKGCPMPGRR